MSEREHEDLLIARAIEELKKVPAVPPGVTARVAGAAMDAGARDERDGVAGPAVRRRLPRIALYVGLAAAASLIGYVARGVLQPPARPAASAVTPRAALVPVAEASDADARPLPSQFVFQSVTAHHVSLVGDFNDWNPRATPLERAAGSGRWAVTVPVAPGRHSYAFMVDDTLFALDPHAPVLTDRDLGTKASVVVVGRP